MMDFTKIKDKKAAGKCFDYAILPKETTEAEIRMHCKKAIEHNCIVPSFRFPIVIRLAPIAFYTSYEDIYEMVERIIRIMETREYEKYENKIGSIA